VRSRYRWLGQMRDLAARGMHWQQALRGRVVRWGSSAARHGDTLEFVPRKGEDRA
jgi:hypothetical protein